LQALSDFLAIFQSIQTKKKEKKKKKKKERTEDNFCLTSLNELICY